MTDFSSLGIKEDILRAISDIGWTEPTPIQAESVPYGMKGRDLLAQAQTGTGKTGAFGSIILSRISPKKAWAQALILTPTRELALQIYDDLAALSKYSGHTAVAVYGGVSMKRQTQTMDKGIDIIIATPGRLCDHLKDDERLLDDVSVIVLDEADRMLDMGFRRDLGFILERVPSERQTMLFSATMSKEVRKLAMQYLIDPKEISVSKDEPVLDLIDQRYITAEKEQKIDLLRYVLAKDPMKTIVFCYTKYRVDKVVRKLKMSFRLAGIHGEYSQNRREETMRRFREGDIQVLVASDIASRGLDIEGVERIINFDMPPEAETYIHRIGRTGRAGNKGIAISFVMGEDRKLMKEIANLTLQDMTEIPYPSDREMASVLSGIKPLDRPVMAKKNSKRNEVPVKDKVFIVAEMNIGRAEGLSKASVSQLVRENTDVPRKSIGNISVGERTSTLEVESKYYSKTENGLSGKKVNGKSIKMWKVSEVEVPITENLETAEDVLMKEERKERRTSGDDRRKDVRTRDDSHRKGRSQNRVRDPGDKGERSYSGQKSGRNSRDGGPRAKGYRKDDRPSREHDGPADGNGRTRSDVRDRDDDGKYHSDRPYSGGRKDGSRKKDARPYAAKTGDGDGRRKKNGDRGTDRKGSDGIRNSGELRTLRPKGKRPYSPRRY